MHTPLRNVLSTNFSATGEIFEELKKIARDASDEERPQLFHDNAVKFYRLK